MKTIRVGFSTHKGSFSWLIRTATASEISHTYLRIPVPQYNRDVIFQASGLVVNYTAGDVFAEHSEIIEEYEVDILDTQAALGERFRVTEVGKPYSMKQIVGFIGVIVARQVLNKQIPNPFSDGNHAYVCVEVVTDCIGLEGGEAMTPEDLRRWCKKNARLVYKKSI